MSTQSKANNSLHYLVDEKDIFFKPNVGKKFKKLEICPDTYNGTSLLFYDNDSDGYYVVTFNTEGIYYIWTNGEGVKTTLGYRPGWGLKRFRNFLDSIAPKLHMA